MKSNLLAKWNCYLKKIKHFWGPNPKTLAERGQVLVIMIISFTALLAFVGMVTDIGAVYVTFTQLKRAVDAAAVAAANNIKNPVLSESETAGLTETEIEALKETRMRNYIREGAREMLTFHNVTDITSLETYICDDASKPAEFDTVCPETGPPENESPRKLAWVQATQDVPVYFLHLFGIESIPLTTHSIGEAATVDLVIVIDSSESMGNATPGYEEGNFIPSDHALSDLQPLQDAKVAAKKLVGSLFENYDQIAVVQFDFDAEVKTNPILDGNFTDVKTKIDNIQLHDDPNVNDVDNFPEEYLPTETNVHPYNLDGDDCLGDLDDNSVACGSPTSTENLTNDSFTSTCTGCAIRLAGNILKQEARSNSIWVIVFLTDGVTNVSDVPDIVDAGLFPNGYCLGPESDNASPWCQDGDPTIRHCGPHHTDVSECPPDDIDTETPWQDVIWVGNDGVGDGPPYEGNGYYDAEDYAYDMVDQVALTASTNANESIIGNDIVIYSIGLGQAATSSTNYVGEELLRYMANVGDDGTRLNDPCDGIAPQEQCGNYYYAPGSSYLDQIFESIAARIYTRISY